MNDEPEFLRIRNWERFQEYKDGRPMKFFRVHTSILDDPTFGKLADDATVFQMMALAARTGNKIPNDGEYLQRVLLSDRPVNIERMLAAGFLEIAVGNLDDASIAKKTGSNGVVEPSVEKRRASTETHQKRIEEKRKNKTLVAASPTTGEGSGKQRDLIWDALVDELGTSPATRTERGAWNKAVKDLREAGATADEIRTRCSVYRSRWPGVSLTPPALTKHWGSLAGTHGELSAEERNRRWLADLEARGVE